MSCGDCQWWYCKNIDHKCRRRWGCLSFLVVFLLFFSDPPLTFRSLPAAPFRPFASPVHSIRLEYGRVVVDTCTVWSVSQCCCVHDFWLLVLPSSTEQVWTDGWTEERKKKKWREGATQAPYKQKHWFRFHVSLLNSEEPCLDHCPLATATVWNLFLHTWSRNPFTVLDVLSISLLMFCYAVHVENGGGRGKPWCQPWLLGKRWNSPAVLENVSRLCKMVRANPTPKINSLPRIISGFEEFVRHVLSDTLPNNR